MLGEGQLSNCVDPAPSLQSRTGSLSAIMLMLSALFPACSSLLAVLQSLDLTGDREFLTREGAEEALAPMLTSGSQIAKVGKCRPAWSRG